MTRLYLSSDPHFWHKNIIGYCNRPFSDVREMNQALIDNWNSVVNKDDIIFNLGDFAFCSKELIRDIVEQLNGRIILIVGNHDRKPESMRECGFYKVFSRLHTTLLGRSVVFNHKPMPGAKINIHGHVHTEYKFKENMINVGVDQWDFKPVLAEKMWEEYEAHK